MIKNQLYPYIEKYINEFLYGFSKEQFNVGVLNGQIYLENLNLKPDGVNNKMDDKNIPFWLKAGLISKIDIRCSIMNFIGEKPLDVLIENINIILTPSYKWIIRNLDSFMYENESQLRERYNADGNNSMNIFSKKVNILDNSIFRKEKIIEIFKDQTKVCRTINKIFKSCLKFFYEKNFSVNLKVKNFHIRIEDDQLINYNGNIAFGIKAECLEVNLGSEGNIKKDSFKLSNLDVYWENNAKILISSDLLNNSIINGKLDEKYYINLKRIKFQQFSYRPDTKFILEKLNCRGNFGTKSMNSNKMDLFSKGNSNEYKLYIQISTGEININLFPEILKLHDNFQKFIKEFTVIEQVQEFKPMKKPYDITDKNVHDLLNYCKSNKDNQLTKIFAQKRKLSTRDWLFYFYWCHKCRTSIYGKNTNPLRLEFSRFYNLVFNKLEINVDKNKEKINASDGVKFTEDNQNPDNINLSNTIEILIKGINFNLHPFLNSSNKNYVMLKMNEVGLKLNLNKEYLDFSFNIKNIGIGPNKLQFCEQVTINKNYKKRAQNVQGNEGSTGYYYTISNIEDNTGLAGLVKKYNPYIEDKIKLIDIAMGQVGKSSGELLRNDNSSIGIYEENEIHSKIAVYRGTNSTQNNGRDSYFGGSALMSCYSKTGFQEKNGFTKSIMATYEATPIVQKMELKRQKNEFNMSQAINHYNNLKSKARIPNNYKSHANQNLTIQTKTGEDFVNYNDSKYNINTTSKNKKRTNFANEIIPTGQTQAMNLLEISNSNKSKGLEFRFFKTNTSSFTDSFQLQFGNVRLNLFPDYLSSCLDVFLSFQKIYNQFDNYVKNKKIKEIKFQKYLLLVKQYIFNLLNKIPEDKKKPHIKEYINYLKQEINLSKKIGVESGMFQINYILTLFPNGLEISFDYDSFECINFNNNNIITGRVLEPPPEFILKLEPSYVSLKFYEFDMELNDMDNLKSIINIINKILEEKLSVTKLLIEPCINKLRNEINRKNTLVSEMNKDRRENENEYSNSKNKNKIQNKIENEQNLRKEERLDTIHKAPTNCIFDGFGINPKELLMKNKMENDLNDSSKDNPLKKHNNNIINRIEKDDEFIVPITHNQEDDILDDLDQPKVRVPRNFDSIKIQELKRNHRSATEKGQPLKNKQVNNDASKTNGIINKNPKNLKVNNKKEDSSDIIHFTSSNVNALKKQPSQKQNGSNITNFFNEAKKEIQRKESPLYSNKKGNIKKPSSPFEEKTHENSKRNGKNDVKLKKITLNQRKKEVNSSSRIKNQNKTKK